MAGRAEVEDSIQKLKNVIKEEQAFALNSCTAIASEKTGRKNGSKKSKSARKKKSPKDLFDEAVSLYVQYKQVLSSLATFHDGVIQPQMREDIRRTLELVICRLILLRQQLHDLSSKFSDSSPLLDNVAACKVELGEKLVLPRYFREDSLKLRKNLRISLPLDCFGNESGTKEQSEVLIQDESEEGGSVCRENSNDLELLEKEEAELIGLKMCPIQQEKDKILSTACDLAYAQRKQGQLEKAEMYNATLEDIRAELLQEEGPLLFERLHRERMQWILERTTNTSRGFPYSLDEFYNELKGGDSNDNMGGKEEHSEEGSKSTNSSNDQEILLSKLSDSVDVFLDRWKDRMLLLNECNGNLPLDTNLAKELVRPEIESEIVTDVDESVLTYLRRRTNSNKESSSGSGGTKSKAEKKKVKVKPLPGVKLVGQMEFSDMIKLLVDHKLLFDTPQGTSSLTSGFNPTFDKLKESLIESLVLPNGSHTIKNALNSSDDNDDATFTRATLLFGPDEGEMKNVVESVAYHLGALIVRFFPSRLHNVYRRKEDATRLIHMMLTVACHESCGPVVVYIEECEKVFAKATAASSDPMTRFQKDLITYKNQAIGKNNRVLVIGTTTKPELMDNKVIKWKGSHLKPDKQGFFEKSSFVGCQNSHGERFISFAASMLKSNNDGETGNAKDRGKASKKK